MGSGSPGTEDLADDGKRFDALDVGMEPEAVIGEGVRGRGVGKKSCLTGGWRKTWRIFRFLWHSSARMLSFAALRWSQDTCPQTGPRLDPNLYVVIRIHIYLYIFIHIYTYVVYYMCKYVEICANL